jgi:hypothetical protein
MSLSRSTYCDVPSVPTDDAALVATMIAICDEFEALWLSPGGRP